MQILIARIKKAWKSKTIAFGFLLALFSFAQDHLHTLQSYISPKVYPFLTFGVGIVVVASRFVTTKPLEDK